MTIKLSQNDPLVQIIGKALEYKMPEIQNFYKQNKKLLFKKGEKQAIEVNNSWTKAKIYKLTCMILGCALLKQDKQKQKGTFSKILKIDEEVLKDLENISSKMKTTLVYKETIKQLQENDFKNYVYKYIIPKAILNDGKGHYYTSEELQNIADLRYKTENIIELAEEYKHIVTEIDGGNDYTPLETKRQIKRWIELLIIIFFLAKGALKNGEHLKIIESFNNQIKKDLSSQYGVTYGTVCSVMLSMTTGEDKFTIKNLETEVSGLLFPHKIKKLLLFLGELLEDKELKKIM